MRLEVRHQFRLGRRPGLKQGGAQDDPPFGRLLGTGGLCPNIMCKAGHEIPVSGDALNLS